MRALQCDETRPICTQCTKSGRACAGFDSEPGSVQFKSQNGYASNLVQKTRKSRRQSVPSTSSQQVLPVRACNADSSRSTPTRHASVDQGRIPLPLDIPLELQAFTFFAHRWIENPESDFNYMWTFFDHRGLQFEFPNPKSCLGLAIAAVSLAFFSNTRVIPSAVTSGNLRYVQALTKTKETLSDPEQVKTDDSLLTVMALNTYEVSDCILQLDCRLI